MPVLEKSVSIDTTQKEVLRLEVDLATAKFRLQTRDALRIARNALPLIALAWLAHHYGNTQMVGFTLLWGGCITVIQLALYSMGGGPSGDAPQMDVVEIYGKGRLIFVAIWFFLLISFVVVMLCIKAQRITYGGPGPVEQFVDLALERIRYLWAEGARLFQSLGAA